MANRIEIARSWLASMTPSGSGALASTVHQVCLHRVWGGGGSTHLGENEQFPSAEKKPGEIYLGEGAWRMNASTSGKGRLAQACARTWERTPGGAVSMKRSSSRRSGCTSSSIMKRQSEEMRNCQGVGHEGMDRRVR